MRTATTLLLCLSIAIRGFSQEYHPENIVPPSPTAASLGTYGEIPVSYYTGRTNLEIPIYTIKTNTHSLPITLQYSNNGIKVGQDASWVGLGWSLNAGGVITRTIRGLDDFLNDKGYYMLEQLPPNDEDNYYQYPGDNSPLRIIYGKYFSDIKRGNKDGEPDIFFYNFGSYTGKFIIGKKADGGRIFIAQANNLKITYDDIQTSGAYGTWKVTTPEGFNYYFSTPEQIETYYSNSGLATQPLQGLEPNYRRSYMESVSAWYLDSIISPAGEKISLAYETGRSLSSVMESQKRYDRYSGNLSLLYSYYNLTRSDIRDVYVKKITFTNGYLEFNRESRIDIEKFPGTSAIHGPQKLSEVILYNNSNQPVKKWGLAHSYFNNANTGLSYHYKRLKLDSLTEAGSDGVYSKPYVFTYFDPENLPSKYSRQTDIWGYNTSFYSPILAGEYKTTLLPPVNITLGTDLHIDLDGVNRTPDSVGNLVTRGMLTDVKYPTGGKTVFQYEINDYPEQVTNTYTTGTITYRVDQNYDFPQNGTPSLDFTITNSQPAKLTLHAYCLPASDPVPNVDMAYIINRNGNAVYAVYNLANGTPVNNDPSNKVQTFTLNLPPGNYRLVCNMITDFSVDCGLEVGQPQVHTVTTTVNRKGGGLRIKAIVNFDFNGKKLTTKKFVYSQNGLEGGLSSGIVYKPLQGFRVPAIECLLNNIYSGECVVRSSTTMSPLGLFSEPGPVCYSNVTVYEGESGEGGSTMYNYHNTYKVQGTNFLDFQVPANADGLNGKVMTMELRDNQRRLVKKTSYEYEKKYADVVKGVVVAHPAFDQCDLILYDTHVKYYDNISEWFVPTVEKEDNYLNGSVISTAKTLHFEDSIHKLITSQEMKDSDGSIISTQFKYPGDFIDQPPYTQMVDRNIISPVVEKIISRNNVPMASTKTNFNNWNGYFAPETVNQKKGGGNYEARVRFHGYDAKGNVLASSKENDFITSYVWGYNKNFPVIKADNISSANLHNAVHNALLAIGINGIDNLDVFLNSLGALTTTQQKTALKNFTAALRTQLASYKTTYSVFTYTPLTGIVSVTDGNNITTYYEYDPFGRLLVTKDNDGNIINSYKYNYRY